MDAEMDAPDLSGFPEWVNEKLIAATIDAWRTMGYGNLSVAKAVSILICFAQLIEAVKQMNDRETDKAEP